MLLQKIKFNSVFVTLLFAFFLAGCSDGNDSGRSKTTEEMQPSAPGMMLFNIAETAVNAGDFNTLVTALQAAGLDSVLADESKTFTVFAPTDAAFAELGEDTVNALLADIDTLTDILLYHVIADQAVNAETALSLAGSTVEMANGDAVAITVQDDKLFINGAEVVTADIEASNGIIHVIDTVLIPSTDTEGAGTITDTAIAAGSFTTLVAALQATGLDAALADETATYTVFAPTDDAFALLGEDAINALLADTDTLSDILLYHVIGNSAVDAVTALSLAGTEVEMANGATARLSINGERLFINQAEVVSTDIVASNGIIHVIDAVLTPPSDEAGSITDIAVADGGFTTLVAALQATGLDVALADETATYTVFAPTDEAFAALGEDAINGLLMDTDTLSNILLYHVIGDIAVDAETALSLAGSMVEMLNGDSSTLTVEGGKLFIDEAEVIVTDIAASNGIIHVIDMVITPAN